VTISAILGAVAITLVIVGYLPQISHLIKERCSAGISVAAFSMWLAASALFFIHAALMDDVVFLVAQTVNLTAGGIVVALCQTYKGHVCSFHATRGQDRHWRRR
jgi:uncharacterized protein with PQ loop repeat